MSDCILYTGYLNDAGYGVRSRGLAHRVAYEDKHGHCPPLLRHTCDTPACINPDHLIPGTQAENMRDMVERGRSCRGEARATKLTQEQVNFIRANYVKGRGRFRGNGRELAARFGVSADMIQKIGKGTRWIYSA